MITPIEIQSKTFKSGGLGYDKKDVDGFFREVLRSYEQIYRENMELNDKVAVLTEGIQYYKTIEKTLQKALVLAEKTAEDTKAAALEKAKAIEKEANTRSQLIVADAKNELEHIHNQTIQLIQQYEKYKQQFKHLALAQMELIESECFDINVARLDAFIDSKQDRVRETGSQEQPIQQAGQKQVEKRHVDQRNVGQRQSEQRQTEQRQSEQRQAKYRQTGQSQVPPSQSLQKLEKRYAKQEKYPLDMEPSFFDALEQVGATKEDMDTSYPNINRYTNQDEDDYPYEQSEIENQDEFSFINLVDEED